MLSDGMLEGHSWRKCLPGYSVLVLNCSQKNLFICLRLEVRRLERPSEQQWGRVALLCPLLQLKRLPFTSGFCPLQWKRLWGWPRFFESHLKSIITVRRYYSNHLQTSSGVILGCESLCSSNYNCKE